MQETSPAQQPLIQQTSQSDNEQFQILQALSPQQLQKLNHERKCQLQQFYQINKRYEISSWYDKLKQFTFKSNRIQLNAMDAYVLQFLYYNQHDVNKMDHKIMDYYIQLKAKIDLFIQQSLQLFQKQSTFKKTQKRQCFMKLSTRSPKDSGYKYTTQQIQQIAQNLSKHLSTKFNCKQQKTLSTPFINQIYRYFLDQSKQKFKITNSADFINIFSHSQRIIIDICDFSFMKSQVFAEFDKKNYNRASQPFIQLWCRQWLDFKWLQQMRCFYSNYQLRAASQYDQRCYFPQLSTQSTPIQKSLLRYFQKLKPSLKSLQLQQGVIDILLINLGSQDQSLEIQPILIQINVFNVNSRASLFSWKVDQNLLKGQTETIFQLRILNQPKIISKYQLTKLMGMIQKGTHQIITKTMQILGLDQDWQAYQ